MRVLRASSAIPVWSAVVVSLLAVVVDDLAWAAVFLLLLAAIPRRVEVGAEGLRIAWLGFAKLVRYDEVRRAEPSGRGDVLLTFDEGETLRLARGGDVLDLIWETVTLGAEGRPRVNERVLLARGERPLGKWLEELSELCAAGPQYRCGLLGVERLLSIATNPAVEIELRVAAAVAFAASGCLDDATREELQAIAKLTVDRALEATFTRIAAARTPADLHAALREVA